VRIPERAKECFRVPEAEFDRKCLVAETQQIGKGFIEGHRLKFQVSSFKFQLQGGQPETLNLKPETQALSWNFSPESWAVLSLVISGFIMKLSALIMYSRI